MRLRDLRIDADTWSEADDARRREWAAVIDAVLGDRTLSFPREAHRLSVTLAADATSLTLESAAGESLATCSIPHDALAEQVSEYVGIVRKLTAAEGGLGSARVEALDFAKKVVHDDAARRLARLCRPLGADHDTCRRLWTLLLALRIDTAMIVGLRAHRRRRRAPR